MKGATMKLTEALEIAKPILFNTEMVRAILDGKKTVTRRVVKPKFSNTEIVIKGGKAFESNSSPIMVEITPHFRIGDILYVRETWREIGGIGDREYIYRADDDMGTDRWYPSIHMPKEAARIFLQVTGVRVERLQDINERGKSSAAEEGFVNDIDIMRGTGKSAARHFTDLWNNTVKKSDLDKYGWAANPWVWVIEFEKLEVTV